MKLTNSDIRYLKKNGYTNKDLPQIEEATVVTRYRYQDKLISAAKAVSLLGRENYLNGVSRSTFHATGTALTDDGQEILFDSRALFTK